MNVMLSIIIPAYNTGDYLEACVHSVLSGTYRDFEILLIDDGSVDRTGAICDRLRMEYPQIRVFHTENRGLPSARNLGIEHASGRFVGFVDADDLVSPDMFASLIHAMGSDVQLSACKFLRVKRSQASVTPGEPVQHITHTQAEAAEHILRGDYGPYVWNKLYRKEILDSHSIRFPLDSQGCEDLYFNAAYLRYCNKAVFLDQPMYYYILTDGSIMHTFRENRIVSRQYVSLPRANRFAAEVMAEISENLMIWSQSRAAMFYQTVLRKLEAPDEAYIQEAISYVRQHKFTLLRYPWGLKYYFSALVLCISYPLWAKIFRRGLLTREESAAMGQPTLIVSLDFELFWGMQDGWELSEYEANILGGRKAIPQMLEMFRKHGIHATWAAVGFLFGKDEEELRRFFPEQLPSYENEKLSCYRCFGTIGSDEQTAPCYYGSSLLERIASVPGQELGSHTFSHYYCREPGQTTEQFRADMEAAKAIGKAHGFALKSVVLPRNQCEPEYTKVLTELGFTAYRDEENDWIHEKVKFRPLMRILRLLDVYFPLTGQGGYEPKLENGIVNLVGSRMYKPYFKPLAFLEGLKVRRIKKQLLHAAKTGKTFHLWWHPHNVGVHTDFHMKQLEEIFSYYEELKETFGMRSLNMTEAAQEALNR